MSQGKHLSVTKLSCERAGLPLFAALTFQVNAQDIWHITGGNGVGKTSLLRVLLGILPAYQGDYQWHTDKLAYIGHRMAINPWLTVRENCLYQCSMHNVSPDRLLSALDYFALLDVADELAATLSQGQQQRLALTRLMLIPAHCWLLDEPFTALDVLAQQALTQLLNRHIQQQGSALIVSHGELPLFSQSPRRLQLAQATGVLHA